LADMGLPEDLTARVMEIDPCPPIRKGMGRVVLTTVNHLNAAVRELTVQSDLGREETIRPTAFHKFFRADDGKWVSAADLHRGNQLHGNSGPVTVTANRSITGVHRVYNLTVEGEHVYHVSALGVLVHNSGCLDSLFDEFGIKSGRKLNLNAPSTSDGRSFITYAFKNSDDEIVYVGKASGVGTPLEVLKRRIAKGHDHYHDGLKEVVLDVQQSKLASQGAEEFFIQAFREQGAKLTNVNEALSYKDADRIKKSLAKIEAFIEDLMNR